MGGGVVLTILMQFPISCRKMLRRPRGPDLISALSIGDLLITEASRGILCAGLPSSQIAKWAGGRCSEGGGCWFKSDIKFVEFCGRESGSACYLLKSLPEAALRVVLCSVIHQ